MRKPLLMVLVMVSLAVAAACSKAGKTRSATPPSSPTPEGTQCQVLWSSSGSTPGSTNVFIVSGPLSSWTSGTHSFSGIPGEPAAYFYYSELETSNGSSYLGAAEATTGSWSVTGSATSGTLGLNLSSLGYSFFSIQSGGQLGAQVGQGGTGSFQGSNGSGSGTVAITYLGSALAMGQTTFQDCFSAAP